MPKEDGLSIKIESINAYMVASPDSPLGNRDGVHYPWFFRGIVIATADNGLTGLAEIPGIQNAIDIINSEETQKLVRGRSVLHYARIIEDFEAAHPEIRTTKRGQKTTWDPRGPIHSLAGVDVALHDLFARFDGTPLFEVIGHPYRDHTRFNAYGFFVVDPARTGLEYIPDDSGTAWAIQKMKEAMTPEAVADQFDVLIAHGGFTDAKLKGGFADPDLEADAVLEIKRRHPNVRVTIDPNGCWSLETAYRIDAKLKGVVDYMEDPVAGTGPMGQYQRKTHTPTATNMAVTSLEEFADGIRNGSISIMLADPMFFGGMRQSKIVTRMCEAVDWQVGCHSNNHLLIELLQMASLGTQVKDPTAYDTHFPWTRRMYDVVHAPEIEIRDSVVVLPKKPGLGVELNTEMFEARKADAQRLIAAGYTGRDDSGPMSNIFGIPWKGDPSKHALAGLEY